MTAPTIRSNRPRLANTQPRRETVLLIATAARGDITRETRNPWPVHLINGTERPDARVVIAGLIRDGWLYDTAPNAPVSQILPTPAGLSKIGVTR